MIQRIQSLYLLLVAAAMVAVAVLPLGVLAGDGLVVTYSAFTATSVGDVLASNYPVWVMGVLAVLSSLVALVTIFLYKMRSRQTTLCMVNGFVLVLFYVAYFLFYFTIQRGSDVDFSPALSVALPLVALLFNLLAIKAIAKDVALLASLDRLR
jgi:glucan phosphoethanolaminetransferase (alkaline phosphatase superfamily)